jgi:membrane-associated phospholipid phosphatase
VLSGGAVIAGLGWVVALLQVPAAVRSRWKRVPLLVFSGLAVAATMDLPAVNAPLDHATKITDLGTFVKHVTSAVACCALVDWVVTLEEPRPARWHARHWYSFGVVLAVMTVLFVLAPKRETNDFTFTETSGLATAYLIVYLTFFAACCGITALRFWRGARSTLPGVLRTGIWLLAAGAATGAVYAGIEITLVSLRAAGASPGTPSPALDAASGLVPLAAGLILASMLVPPASHLFLAAGRLRAYHSLRPLWRALTAEVPGLALRLPSRHGLPAGLEIRMIRRVAEIRDGILLMRRRVGPAALASARAMLADRGLDGPDLDAAVEACAIGLGLRTPHGAPTPGPGARSVAAPGRSDLTGEVALLRAVQAQCGSPAVRQVVAALAPCPSGALGTAQAVRSSGGRVSSVTAVDEMRKPSALARVVTEVLSPVPLVAAMQVLLGWAGGQHRVSGLAFGAAAVLITIVPPYAFVLYGTWRGRFTDRHLGDHRQRPLPLLLGVAASAAGIAVLALAGAPRLLIVGTAVTGIGLLLGAVISRFWKMSGHTAAAAAVLAVCAWTFGGWLLLAIPVIALIGWSRVRLGDHTLAQVAVGAVFGAVVVVAALPPLAG